MLREHVDTARGCGDRRAVVTRGRITLITGGARGGKSARAQALAAADGRAVAFLATAQATDEEFRRRIDRHRQDRPAAWLDHRGAVAARGGGQRAWHRPRCYWLTTSAFGSPTGCWRKPATRKRRPGTAQVNRLEAGLAAEAERLTSGVPEGNRLILVTQETGWGVVPPYPLGRAFRDALGRLNQRVAAAADEVTLMVAGLYDLKRRPADVGCPGDESPG